MREIDCEGNWVLFWWVGTMLSKSLIQFSVDGRGCVPSPLFSLRSNYGRGNNGNGDLLLKDFGWNCCIQCPWPSNRPLVSHASTGDSWILQILQNFWGSVSWEQLGWVIWLRVPHEAGIRCTLELQPSEGFSGASLSKVILKILQARLQ